MTNPIKTIWESCYDDSWQDLIVPDAFAHPAKMARGLLTRILRHAAAESWLRPGAVILDPFGGIGSTGILGAYQGYCVVCCELEQKFVDLALQNFALHAKKLERLGCPQPVMIQGDSRELCRIVSECDCIVSSPPWTDQEGSMQSKKFKDAEGSAKMLADRCADGTTKGHYATPAARKRQMDKANNQEYGQTPGQLGQMKPGSADAVISSPPYAEAQTGGGIAKKGYQNEQKRKGVFDLVGKRSYTPETHGQTEGNLGNLKPGDVEAIISSPPYEQGLGHGGGPCTSTDQLKRLCNQKRGYGETAGQLENVQGDTFWSAAKLIVQQCHQILKPGGVAIWVVKAFVRNKKIVDFPGDWRRLCESVGFKTICEHHAMLVKETRTDGLFGGEIVDKKERKSFFRRLAESKGSPPIDYENVLCMKKEL